MANLFMNIITFGAAERLEDAQYEYEETCERYNDKIRECKNMQAGYKRALKTFSELQQKSQQEAMKICLFVPANVKERKTLFAQLNIPHEKIIAIEHTLDKAEIFQNYAKLLSQATMITHSVGTTLPTTVSLLAGANLVKTAPSVVAASGMIAGGSSLAISSFAVPAVSTGLTPLGVTAATAAIPVVNVLAVASMPIVSHLTASSQINDLESEMYDIEEKIGEVNKTYLRLKRNKKRMAEVNKSLREALKSFAFEYEKAVKKIYPKWIDDKTPQKEWNSYAEDEKLAVLNLINATYEMLKIRNTKIRGSKSKRKVKSDVCENSMANNDNLFERIKKTIPNNNK